MDYTAITVSLITLSGLLIQMFYNTKMVKRSSLKKEFDSTQTKLDLVSKGQMYLLQEKLLELCERVLRRGSVSITEMKLLTNMYYSYHELGGNDFISELYEKVEELPIKGE